MIKQKTEASTQKIYKITLEDLPLSCPLPSMRLWDSHPRVYMPIAETGKEVCPYCSAMYILTTPSISNDLTQNDGVTDYLKVSNSES